MLAHRSSFVHPTAGQIDLPLLIPAFSSKGFGFIQKGRPSNRRQFSEIAYELAEFGKRPARAVLLSAYDLHHSYYRAPDLAPSSPLSHLRNVNLVFLDSGGYELSS